MRAIGCFRLAAHVCGRVWVFGMSRVTVNVFVCSWVIVCHVMCRWRSLGSVVVPSPVAPASFSGGGCGVLSFGRGAVPYSRAPSGPSRCLCSGSKCDQDLCTF